MFAWCWPGDPPAGAGPRSGGRAAGRRGRPGCSLLCSWFCGLARLAALLLALLPAVGGVLLPALPPVRIAAGVFVPALVVLVAVKEQGGRVIRGRGGPAWCRVCCSPGRADLGPGCSTRCRIAGGVAGVFLVPVLVLAG